MSKEEWIGIIDSARNEAERDYYRAESGTQEEYMAQLCMSIFDYLSSAIKVSNNRYVKQSEKP